MDANEILDAATSSSFAIWFLIGASLVFFMQAGFAMVETGFTRAKNAGNIIMKNLMDFLCNSSINCFRSYGWKNKIQCLLCLLSSNQFDCISYWSRLGLELRRKRMVTEITFRRFRRFSSNPLSRWYGSFSRSNYSWSQNW